MRNEFTIAVVGIGLIGGSILKAFRPKKFHLIGVSRSEETLRKAVELNLADEISTDIDLVKSADVVFICTPISKIISTIDAVRKIVRPDCIITDVASLKGFIIDHVNDYSFPANYIGGHPMAGTEHQGIDYAVDDLFDGAKWVLTPSKWANSNDVDKLKKLLHSIGAKTIIADAHQHDKAVALISHLPLLLSETLFGFVESYPDDEIRELGLKLAASGFRDTTRLAGTNPELAKDMLIENKINIKEAANELKIYLDCLTSNLDTNKNEFVSQVEKISDKRKKMYSPEGINIY